VAEETGGNETETVTVSSSNAGDIVAGSLVNIVSGATYYSGLSIPSWVLSHSWYVHSVNGNRAVINKSEDGSRFIMSPIDVKYLQIANTATSTTTASTQTYTVKRGDTLWAIAKTVLGNPLRYTEIKSLNNLSSNIIQIGQILTLPEN
jgi:nucleoid-associated protein YgaU